MTKATVSQAAIERTLRALKRVGERIATVENKPDGSVMVLTADGKETALSPLEQWRQKHGRHAA